MRSCQIARDVPFGHWAEYQKLAISSDGSRIALAGSRERILIVESANGKIVRNIPFNDAVNMTVMSGDLLLLGAANSDSIRVVSMSTGKEQKPIELK
jgi:hypothetical protein